MLLPANGGKPNGSSIADASLELPVASSISSRQNSIVLLLEAFADIYGTRDAFFSPTSSMPLFCHLHNRFRFLARHSP